MTEVRALYGRLGCGWLGGVFAWRPSIRWEVGVAGYRRGRCTEVAGRNGRCASTGGGFLVSIICTNSIAKQIQTPDPTPLGTGSRAWGARPVFHPFASIRPILREFMQHWLVFIKTRTRWSLSDAYKNDRGLLKESLYSLY